MGGCATKPEVLKDDSDVKAPEPELEPEPSKVDVVDETNVSEEPQPEINTGVDDDQTNKRRSLSLLFNKENDDTNVSTENDKTVVEEIVKQETLEAQKPLEDSKSNEPIVKHESSKAEDKNKLLNNEPVEQDSPLLIKLEEKSSVQNESSKLDEEIAKLESKIEELLEENQIIETPKQEFVDAKETPNTGSVPKIITEKATHSSREEKNHNEVEHESKASDASNIKT
ncbi:PREDICTED: probable serine/threonine-protein kinase kinX isoform X2 [Lupinus angustifolius]|uniref:probable serine/threonine-protein kinase kinX isoform X2 n=1 Tax=Lupinus angustifolius TaxID=3871 RepID=UPI00092E9332|nr:PREDICTED: probable serine/threonine-protein kinase kinX isoform X2 [Lupinus angustifolius]